MKRNIGKKIISIGATAGILLSMIPSALAGGKSTTATPGTTGVDVVNGQTNNNQNALTQTGVVGNNPQFINVNPGSGFIRSAIDSCQVPTDTTSIGATGGAAFFNDSFASYGVNLYVAHTWNHVGNAPKNCDEFARASLELLKAKKESQELQNRGNRALICITAVRASIVETKDRILFIQGQGLLPEGCPEIKINTASTPRVEQVPPVDRQTPPVPPTGTTPKRGG